ncbi:hypothetical protein BSL78_07599 [Apostichopus japonicus]|uniref:Uncharacterized protein n=1 Tax=Stichopus japonicus TaxID=307972 RepID=A0A2G8L5H9_STIJA|nr:hypothetical protein BSL78_07599 [Apostichopus japonicus]
MKKIKITGNMLSIVSMQLQNAHLENDRAQWPNFESELGKALEFQVKRLDSLEIKMAAKIKECEELNHRVTHLAKALNNTSSDTNKMERMPRRNDFRVVGVPQYEGEDCEAIVKSTVTPLLPDAPNISIERCHRDGRGQGDRAPHILVRCHSFKDKVFVMTNRRTALVGQTFFIVDDDDLTKIDLTEKKKWSTQVKNLYDQGTK